MVFRNEYEYFGDICSTRLAISEYGHAHLNFDILWPFQALHQTQSCFILEFVHAKIKNMFYYWFVYAKNKWNYYDKPKELIVNSTNIGRCLCVHDFHVEIDVLIPTWPFVCEKNSSSRRQRHLRHQRYEVERNRRWSTIALCVSVIACQWNSLATAVIWQLINIKSSLNKSKIQLWNRCERNLNLWKDWLTFCAWDHSYSQVGNFCTCICSFREHLCKLHSVRCTHSPSYIHQYPFNWKW